MIRRLSGRFLFLFILLAPLSPGLTAQQYGLEVEVVAEDIGVLVGTLGTTDLTGFSCTRLYVTMVNTTDFMSSVAGNMNNPTYVNTTTTFYHAALGAATPSGINSLLFPVYPDVQYDSWVTIGLEGVPNALAGEAAVLTVQSLENPWVTNFDPGAGQPGGSIVIDDLIGGAWFALNGDANGVAGDDLQVLVGQFTTTGELSGQLDCQIFIQGDGQDEFRDTFYFGAGSEVNGCTDAEACNYNAEATTDDGSCEYPIDLFASDNVDCNGECLNDADGDLICDEYEVGGCQDEAACNYDAAATDDDGSCEYVSDDCVDCDGNVTGGWSPSLGYGLELVRVAENIGPIVSPLGVQDLTGYKCTRVYVTMENQDDFLSSISGDANNPTYVNTTTDFYQAQLGAVTPNGINSLLFGVYPELAYDSWVTIGLEGVADADAGEANVSTVASSSNPWVTNFDPGAGMPGGSIVIDDVIGGAWYAINGDANGIAGEDLRVLAGQFTTTGQFSGQLYVQIFPNGDGQNEVPGEDGASRPTYFFDEADGVTDAVIGCMDPNACNYDACAMIDLFGDTWPLGDYSNPDVCAYPDEGYGCDGQCLNDADGDGVCDLLEMAGCTDGTACNFDESATDDDGSCDYTCIGCLDAVACNFDASATVSDPGSCVYPLDIFGNPYVDCNGSCVNDADGDDVCDELEVLGCTALGACNFDAAATDDDGSCDFESCLGCMDEEACNYEVTATLPGDCVFPEDLYGSAYADCDGNCLPGQAESGAVGGYSLTVDTVSDDIGLLVGTVGVVDLTGYACIRAYITMENEEDFLSAISGDSNHPTYITTTTSFYHSALGGPTANGINALLFPAFPDVEYDSWVTIGLDGVPDAGAGEVPIGTVQSFDNPWLDQFDPGGGMPGTSVAIDDINGGAWYALNGDANGVAGPDLKVLAGQFTTDGNLSLQFYTQIFRYGNGVNTVENEDGHLPTFIWGVQDDRPGCVDAAACNYDPCATVNDGSCTYPETDYVDCDGGCLSDADGDGVCDEEEVCADPASCNYDPDFLDPVWTLPMCLTVDTVAVHASGALEGMTTYRIYVTCPSADDFVSAVGGYDLNPVYLNTTTTFYQHPLGGPTPSGINPILYGDFPELVYDSWVTIGLDEAPDASAGEGVINTVQGTENAWVEAFDPGFGTPGSSIVLDDEVGGAWFALNGDANGIAGNHPDQRVLLAQLTTDGELAGQLYVQYFSEGNQNQIVEVTRVIGESCFLPNPDCVYPVDLFGVDNLDCDGQCILDTDGDGICDEDEIPGCQDESACNFNGAATDDDGSCYDIDFAVLTEQVSCFDAQDGTLHLDINAATLPVEVSVTDVFSSLVLYIDSLDLSGLPNGLYVIELEDELGCFGDTAVLVGEPDPLSFSIGIDGECAPPGGLAVSTYAFGGTPPYSIVATGDTPVSVTSGSMGPGPDVFLMPDDWLINAVDDNGCVSDTVYFSLPPCTGCNDEFACNFDPQALEDDGSCTYPLESYLDCAGNCLNDTDGDGVCDEIEVPGCTWPYACNYNPEATDENGSCYLASVFFDCDGNCQLDLNENGLCDFFEDLTSGTAYCGPGTVWDPDAGACIPNDNCPSDINEDGYIGVADLLDLLSDYETYCE